MPALVQRTITSRRQAAATRAARRAATDPTMTATQTLDCDVQVTDLSCSVIANRIRSKKNTVIVKVANCSPLPLLAGQTVTAGLYASAADNEPIEGTSLVTIPVTDLFAGGKPLTKVVRLQAENLTEDQQAFIKVIVKDGEETVTDVTPANNHVPVPLYTKDGNLVTLLGDANVDGTVSIADVTAIINHINGNTSGSFYEKAADVNGDGVISIADVTGVINIINQ